MSEEELKQEETVEVELEQPESEPEQQQQQQQLELEQKTEPEVSAEPAKEEDSKEGDSDEHIEYSKNVQKRIKKLTEKYRQEERDREEAVRVAQKLKEENEQLKSQMENSQQAHLTEYGARIDNQLDLIKKAYKDAHDRGDADALVEAQQKLSQITIEQERYRLAKAQQEKVSVQKEEVTSTEVSSTEAPTQQATKPDPRAEEWATKNEWFGQDEVMTYAAFGIHRKLVEEQGFDPTSDEYYNEIDKQIRSEFPHKFAGQPNGRSGQVASADTSASRKKSGRRTVKLSPSQVAIANKLGVPLEEYAKYVKD